MNHTITLSLFFEFIYDKFKCIVKHIVLKNFTSTSIAKGKTSHAIGSKVEDHLQNPKNKSFKGNLLTFIPFGQLNIYVV